MVAISQGNGNILLIPITPVSRWVVTVNEMHPYPVQRILLFFRGKYLPLPLLTLAYIEVLSTRRNASISLSPFFLCLPSPLLSLSSRPPRHPLTFVNPSVELNCWPVLWEGKSVKLNDFVARRHATRRHRLTIASVNFINHARVHFATRRQTSVYIYTYIYMARTSD